MLNAHKQPGKLDLSQFDNITNAIGKLNVQASIRISELNNTGSVQAKTAAFQQQQLRQQAAKDEDLANKQYSGFFRSKAKTKQTKNRFKESPQRGKSTTAEGNNNNNEKDTTKDECLNQSQAASATKRPSASNSSSRLIEPNLEQKNRSNSTPSSSSSHKSTTITTKNSIFHPTPILSDSISNLNIDKLCDNDFTSREPPKPAPRTSHSSNAKKSISPAPQPVTAVTSTSSTLNYTPTTAATLSTTTTPSVTATSTAGALNGPKRLSNPRQNHGRAVAPPQLPDSMRITATASSSKNRLDSERPSYDVIAQLSGDDGAIDFSQSPIAQRLLRHTKDYKGRYSTSAITLAYID